VPPALTEAIDVVLADIRATGTAEPEVEDNDWVNDADQASATIRWPDGTGTGISVMVDWPLSERIALLADKFQEDIVGELNSLGRSAVWPECPDHPNSHPLKPQDLDGTAMWLCPRTERPIASIGSLGSHAV
jgi:hypothetical protein